MILCEVMRLPAIDILRFNILPLEAKKCYKFKEIWIPLLLVPQLYKSKLTVKFEGETVEMSDKEEDILITGFLDPVKNLSMVPSYSQAAEDQRMEKEIAGAAEQ